MEPSVCLVVDGLVRRGGRIDLRSIPVSGAASPRSRRVIRSVSFHDVFAAVALDAEADVVVFVGSCGRSVAAPVRDVLALGAVRIDRRGCITLDLPGWCDAGRRLEIVSVHAVTFAAFIGHPVGERPGDPT